MCGVDLLVTEAIQRLHVAAKFLHFSSELETSAAPFWGPSMYRGVLKCVLVLYQTDFHHSQFESLCMFLPGVASPEQPSVSLSDSEEEIDFGFWEKAPVLTGSNSKTDPDADKHRTTDNVHELDLGLL